MSVEAEVEFLAARSERPIYYASSAGRDAKHEIDQPMQQVTVEVTEARGRADEAEAREFGQHPSGFDLFEYPTRVNDFLDSVQIESVYEPELASAIARVLPLRNIVAYEEWTYEPPYHGCLLFDFPNAYGFDDAIRLRRPRDARWAR